MFTRSYTEFIEAKYRPFYFGYRNLFLSLDAADRQTQEKLKDLLHLTTAGIDSVYLQFIEQLGQLVQVTKDAFD